MIVRFNINEKGYSADVDNEANLLNFIRTTAELTGTKRGCDDGTCGACTILVNGESQRACKTKLIDLNNKEVVTIEGLSNGDKLHPIQKAFIETGAIQCGFCTPGMVLATLALLSKNPKPTRNEIKKALVGNLCRCTGYEQIFRAVEIAAKNM